jgi:hypothetical protein
LSGGEEKLPTNDIEGILYTVASRSAASLCLPFGKKEKFMVTRRAILAQKVQLHRQI